MLLCESYITVLAKCIISSCHLYNKVVGVISARRRFIRNLQGDPSNTAKARPPANGDRSGNWLRRHPMKYRSTPTLRH
jgi:hypothetical protein